MSLVDIVHGLAAAVQGVSIPYGDLPGFPHVGVSGHKSNLVIGDLEGVQVAVFGARSIITRTAIRARCACRWSC